MSQAHYTQCAWIKYDGVLHSAVLAQLTLASGTDIVVCRTCVDDLLDFADRMRTPTLDLEPRRMEWLWDAGTRMCPLHHWPDALCADWSTEHAALIRGLWSVDERRTLVKRDAAPLLST